VLVRFDHVASFPRSVAKLEGLSQLGKDVSIGSSLIWRSCKAAVPAKVQPDGLLQPGESCVETSGDVIEEAFICTTEKPSIGL